MLPDTTNPVTFFCYLGEGGVCTNILRYLMISPLLYLTFASTLMRPHVRHSCNIFLLLILSQVCKPSNIHVIFAYFLVITNSTLSSFTGEKTRDPIVFYEKCH